MKIAARVSIGFGVLMLLMLASDLASPRAWYVRSTPEPLARLEHAPSAVEVAFGADLEFHSALRVSTNSVDLVSTEPVTASGRTMLATLPRNAPDGTYWVSWSATAVDGDSSNGRFGFVVGSPLVEPSAIDLALVESASDWTPRRRRFVLVGGLLMIAIGAASLFAERARR